MKIDRITLGGISNIEKVSLSLSGIDALIAPNNYGKVMFSMRLILDYASFAHLQIKKETDA